MSKNSGSRRQAREAAFQILYRMDGQPAELEQLIAQPARLASELSQHFAHFLVPEAQREFAAQLASGALLERQKIDQLIQGTRTEWKLSRMAAVDRNLLRLAVYEMLHFMDIPPSVTINEAVELAKQFGEAESPAFINGLLDQIAREHRRE
jgi:transcription antitermination protein NusB